MKRIIQFMLALAVLVPLTGYSPAHAIQSLPGLSVSGIQIVANGAPVRLRGINMGDPFWARNPAWYPMFSVNDYATLAGQWHANVVRISIFPTQWKNMDHTQLIDGLSREVNAALDNGMYVIISYHVIGWPDGYYQAAYPGNPADTYDSSMAVATSFWNQMSLTYGSDTRVIFDLWNEPVHPDDFTLYGSDPNPLWPVLKGYYAVLIQTVRNNHAQNIVIATGNRWASWLVGIKDDPLSDPNVVYAYHQYSVEGSNTPAEWNRDTGGLIGVKPVIVSEWGYEDADAGPSPQWPGTAASYGIPFTTWLEDNNLSNLAWMYHYDWTPAMLKADGSLTLYGAFVKNYILGHNAQAGGASVISGCPIFPPDNIWNTAVDTLPVDSHSGDWVNSIGPGTGFHMDFGSGTWDGGPIGIPFNIGSSATPKYTVSFLYAGESDPGPYPIPASPLIEYGSDHHLLVLDQSACKLYELYAAHRNTNGTWSAGSGAIWDLNSDALRPADWTSADAAGLPILPGLVRYDEVASGLINHAIRFTANSTDSYIWPARHLTGGTAGVITSTPPMGARFRLKASYDISTYPIQLQVILQAMKTYGIILADNGSDWYVGGAPDSRWDNDMLHQLDSLTGSDFEAVDSSGLMVDPDSGAAASIFISGNVGVGGVTLNYTDNTPKTAVSQADGSYSLNVSYNWSGTVTPTHTCYTFSSLNRTYSNVVANQTAQNYTPTIKPGCANVNVTIAGTHRGTYGLPSAGSTRINYAGLNDGPAVVASSNAIPIIAAERDAWWDGKEWTSYSQLMGLPAGQVSDTYVFPAYNNVTLDEQMRIGNVDPTQTSVVTVTIGGHLQATYTLLPSQAVRDNYAGVNDGPVIVQGTPGVKIIAAERDSWWDGKEWTSFIQTMGLPASQISDTYVFPAYNNVSLDEQMRIGNVDPTQTSVVTVTIGGHLQATYTLLPNQAVRDNYAGVNDGPVIVKGTAGVKIIAAERDAWWDGKEWTSFAQTMGLPAGQISDTYQFPAYNNVTLDEQMRIGNVDPTQTSVVTVTIGGHLQNTYTLLPNQAVRDNYAGVDSGPVVVRGTAGVKIIAAERDSWWTGTRWTSFVQTLGLPSGLLSTTYVFPAYNNITLDEQLRFGVP